MSMTILGVVFTIALFSCLAVLARITQRKVIEEPLKEGRARGSAITEFVDDLQNHRWSVIIALALLIVLDKAYRFSWRVTAIEAGDWNCDHGVFRRTPVTAPASPASASECPFNRNEST